MRLSIRLAGVVAALAVAACAAATPALAWNPAGAYSVDGSLTVRMNLPPANPTATCTASLSGTLNAGNTNTGDVSGATLAPCTTNVAGCAVAVAAQSPNWALGPNTPPPADVSIGARVRVTYSNAPGLSCLINALQVTLAGTVTAAASNNTTGCTGGKSRTRLTVTNAAGLQITATNDPAVAPLGTTGTTNGTLQTFCLTAPPQQET